MIVKQYIKDFEKYGLGLFVHFGIYSSIERGEWIKHINTITGEMDNEEYYSYTKRFNPDLDWAKNLVKNAKDAGCKYITLTTRHHDGFSLYDTCGLCELDTVHTIGRDLVREFVDACNAEGIVPFFYHTIIDWYQDSFENDFKGYLQYLRDSVEILCKNYGKIGGLWFDGMWHADVDWEEDALYGVIRKYQPDAMIINNTGLSRLGELGHIELDSVTFERGKTQPINMEGAPKYIASEMCETMGEHWGYARNDLKFKSSAYIIEEIAECRKNGANMLLNVGPMGDGSLRKMDEAILEAVGVWTKFYDEAIRNPRPTNIKIEDKDKDFVLADGDNYYLFCYDLPSYIDINVSIAGGVSYEERFELDKTIKNVKWLDNNEELKFEQDGNKVTVHTKPFDYGSNLVVRVAKIEC